MKTNIPTGSTWTFMKNHPSSFKGYYLIRRNNQWTFNYGTPVGYVESDDDRFLEELVAGNVFNIKMEIEIESKEFTYTYHKPQQIKISIISPKRSQSKVKYE